jgi:hypothetical protein
MKPTAALFSMIFGTLLLLPAFLRAGEPGCVSCHTDGARIQSLYVAPDIEFKAEEGEG